MSIFGKIRDAIFGTAHAKPAPSPTVDTTQAPGQAPGRPAPTPDGGGSARGGGGGPAPPLIDVENHMDSLPGADRLNWRTSIVDLMKLLGIDSSLDNRKELARELGYTGDLDGSAEMNIWLHKATMKELAKNGGRVPAGLLD